MQRQLWQRVAAPWLAWLGMTVIGVQAQVGINPGDYLRGLAYAGGKYVMVGSDPAVETAFQGVVYTSADGTNWLRQIGYAPLNGNLVWGNGRFVTFGGYWSYNPSTGYSYQSYFLTSPDGLQWSRQDTGLPWEFRRVLFAGGRFVAVGARGSILTSTDGLTWSNPSSYTDYKLVDVAFGNGQYVTVGENGAVVTSTNALAWTNQYAGTIDNLGGVAFENGRFLATSMHWPENWLAIHASTDGVTWTNIYKTPEPTGYYMDYYYLSDRLFSGNGLFLRPDDSGGVRSSSDGLNWIYGRTEKYINHLVFCQDRYYGLSTGRLLTSPDGLVWLDTSTTNRAPEVSIYSLAQEALAGANFSLGVTVGGNPVPQCQWQFNGTNLAGANAQSLILWNITTNQAGQYQMIASNALGVATSAVITVSVVMQAPVISRSPSNATALVGESMSWLGGVTAAPPAAIQWHFNDTPLAGETNLTLARPLVSFSDAGQYFFVASNALGVATSAVATLTVTTAPPVLTIYYANQTVPEGARVSFAAGASGAPSPQFFLLFNGTNLALPARYGGTFTILQASTNDSGSYAIVASNSVGVVTSAVTTLTVVPGGPLDTWKRRNPIPQGNNLLSVAYGISNFVAVGEFGAILTSADATNWVVENLRTDVVLTRVIFGNGQFMAVGQAGNILGSPDGRNWTLRQVEDVRLSFSGIAFGNGRFVAVTSYDYWDFYYWHLGAIWTSTNGWDWTPCEGPGLPQAFSGITWGNNRFVTVSTDGHVGVSTNGVDWDIQELGDYCRANCIVFGKGRFVALGTGGRASVSGDGYSWTTRTFGSDRRFTSVAYGNNLFVGVATKGVIYTSPDGATWTARNSGTPDRLESVTYASNLFVALGENGTTLTSPDGINWTRQNQGPTRDLDGMALGQGLAVIAGKYGTILTSADGIRFTQQSTGITNDLHGIAYATGRFVAVGEQGTIVISTNAVDWTVSNSAETNSSLKRAAWGYGHWVAVGTQGTILTSPDALIWTRAPSPTLDDLNEVAWGNGVFVIVGDHNPPNATVLISSTGFSWEARGFWTGKNMRAVTFANGQFLAVGNDGVIAVSTNGVNWTRRYSDFSRNGDNFRSVTFTNGLWVITGNDGIIITSSNTVNWTTRAANTIENLHAVEFLNGSFIAIGNRGNIFQSGRLLGPGLAAPGFNPQAGFSLTINAQLGYTQRLQSSTDLQHWSDILVLSGNESVTNFVDSQAVLRSNNFYRVVSP